MATLTVDSWALTEITLDYANQFVPDVLVANANDTLGRGIDLSVTYDGTPLSMTGMSVYLVWRHENGNQDLTRFEAVDAGKGRWKVYYPSAMMHAGRVLARIAIYVGGDTPVTGSRDFRINVERNPIDEDEAMADESFTLFQQAVVDLNGLEARVSDAEAKRVSAEAARVSSENARKSAESLRVSAEQTRSGSESDRAANELNRISAEQRRVTAETLREQDYATVHGEAVEATNAAREAADDATLAAAQARGAVSANLRFSIDVQEIDGVRRLVLADAGEE